MVLNRLPEQNRMEYKSTTKNRGFSLVELIMVMVIMAILAAMIVPRFINVIESLRVRNAVEKIKDDIRYIRDYAVARHDTTWFVVDLSTNSYGIYSGPSSGDRTLIVDPSTNLQQIVDISALYTDVVITSVNFGGNQEMFFDWWGTPGNGGDIVINNSITIKIEAKSGYVYEL